MDLSEDVGAFVPAAEVPETPEPDAADILLAPPAEVPWINLRDPGEPWDKRRLAGKAMRATVPHESHGVWTPPDDRPDPIGLIEAAHEGRQPHLVPLRVARMATSPFAFLRGAAHVMARDLSGTPRTGIDVTMNGDAHISNFGLFGTPQRDIVLDLNDFDEVTVGPWEWDLKRLVASIEVAARQDGIAPADRREAVLAAVGGYQHTMTELAPQGPLDVWHQAARAEDLDFTGLTIDVDSRAVITKAVEKARRKNNKSLLARVGERRVDGGWRFKEEPPILTRVDAETREAVTSALERYAETLPRERRFMISRYHVVDVAHRVVGVGSVGTRAYVALLCGNCDQDVLFLQIKEAVRPAHAPYLAEVDAAEIHEGERVIHGQRLLQAVGDPLLGWTSIDDRPFYVRQMKNMKGEIPVSCMTGQPLFYFSWAYGALLARAHARTGDAAAISGYCGRDRQAGLRESLADWAFAYGDQNDADYRALLQAIADGRLEAAADPEM